MDKEQTKDQYYSKTEVKLKPKAKKEKALPESAGVTEAIKRRRRK